MAADLPHAKLTPRANGPQLGISSDAIALSYALARANWQAKNGFATDKSDKPYRHSLPEEVAALRTLLTVFNELRDSKKSSEEFAERLAKLEPSMRQLAELSAEEMLEPHVLLFRANAEIAEDYPAYREKHRAKLRDYLIKYYLHL